MSNDINRLIGIFLDLHEQWEAAPASFDWAALAALATAGAHEYNEGRGPSFHILCLDGMEHDEFHARFLDDSLAAGFDPFKLVRSSAGSAMTPVFSHDSLASAAARNPWSARMATRLQQVARERSDAAMPA